MNKPLIGLTTNRATETNNRLQATIWYAYIEAVQKAGGIPVLVPPGLTAEEISALRSRLNGILLTGGADIDPARFNGNAHPAVHDIDPLRDELEIELTHLATDTGWPFLGICRGLQVINVALGGTLYTHIADQLPGAIEHTFYPDHPRDYLAHDVTVQSGSRLARIVQADRLPVNSLHHQGIEKLADPLAATAAAPDGLIEAVELPDHPYGLAVQWHPENLPASSEMQALFSSFIQAAERH